MADRARRSRPTQKYIACNADEGDSGTFSDRMLMEGDPFALIEGMTIAGLAVGATQGYIYLRVEYPHAIATLHEAIAAARERRLPRATTSWAAASAFDLEVRLGAGAYICGEETSMLESLEGKRGEVRVQAAAAGDQGPVRQADGRQQRDLAGHACRSSSTRAPRSTATSAWAARAARCRSSSPATSSTAAWSRRPSALTLRELLYDYGGGIASGRPIRAVQVGGPLGAYLPESQFDTPLDYEAFAAHRRAARPRRHRRLRRHASTWRSMARFAMEFCAIESAASARPAASARRAASRSSTGSSPDQRPRDANLDLLDDLCDTMLNGSLCATGRHDAVPVLSALQALSARISAPQLRSAEAAD